MQKSSFNWEVSSEESGSKLLAFLALRTKREYSSRFLKECVNQHCCKINGRVETFCSTVVARGDRVEFIVQKQSSPSIKKLDLKSILFEDNSLLIFNKPSGINCDERGILALFKNYLPSAILVHRLDRDTTGALIIAKNKDVFHKFVDQFKEFSVKKTYLAIVDGILKKDHGIVENYLGKKQEYAGQTIWGSVEKSKGLYACTDWERLEQGNRCSLLKCIPKTGRTHQIRVHLAGIGHPILGDFQYGKKFICIYDPPRYLLHAQEIGFIHPMTHQRMEMTAPLPIDFLEAKEKLFKKV